MFASRFLPCTQCGASIERSQATAHHCDPDRLVEYQVFALRDELSGFEESVRAFLESDSGRFEVWLAARDVRRTWS